MLIYTSHILFLKCLLLIRTILPYTRAIIDKYSTLINRYQGHPLYLKNVANLIQELEISITDLLLNETILLTEEIKDILQKQCDRLSNIEKQIITLLARENEAINLVTMLEKSLISPEDLTNALQSLSRRSLVEKNKVFIIFHPS